MRMSPLMSQLAAPSKIELEILAVLWDQPSATGRAIDEALRAAGGFRRPLAYTTVTTYLDRLVQKGYLTGRPQGMGEAPRCIRRWFRARRCAIIRTCSRGSCAYFA